MRYQSAKDLIGEYRDKIDSLNPISAQTLEATSCRNRGDRLDNARFHAIIPSFAVGRFERSRFGVFIDFKNRLDLKLFRERRRAESAKLNQILQINETKMRVIGNVFAQISRDASIGHYIPYSAGTLGGFARLRSDEGDRIGVISCNHVLVYNNKKSNGDDYIVRPGPRDGGFHPSSSIGKLHSFQSIDFTPGSVNEVDAAFATLDQDVLLKWNDRFDRPFDKRPKIMGVRDFDPSMIEGDSDDAKLSKVFKYGRSTGLTEGGIVSTDRLNLSVLYAPGRKAIFNNVVEIEGKNGKPFSLPGDSGSLVWDIDHFAIGVVFAGTEKRVGRTASSFMIPITKFLDSLSVDLIY